MSLQPKVLRHSTFLVHLFDIPSPSSFDIPCSSVRHSKEAHYRPLFLQHFTSHFISSEVPKLTAAPIKASSMVFMMSPGISCSSTSSVPPAVPARVLPSGCMAVRRAFLRGGLANGHGYTPCYCQVRSHLHHYGRKRHRRCQQAAAHRRQHQGHIAQLPEERRGGGRESL